MKAIFNENREVLTIGENVANADDRNDWVEIKEGNIPNREELKKWGVFVYTIDTKGKITKRNDNTIKKQPAYNEYQARMRSIEYKEKTDSIYLEAEEAKVKGETTEYNKKIAEWLAEKEKIRQDHPYNEE